MKAKAARRAGLLAPASTEPPRRRARPRKRLRITLEHPAHGRLEICQMTDLRLNGVDLTTCSSALGGDAEGAKPVWIQIAKSGTFAGHPSGPFRLDEAVFADIVKNFYATENRAVPIDFEHASEAPATDGSIPTEGAPAQGWIRELKIVGSDLWALVEWGELARAYIREGKYRFISPAIRFNARDRVTGKIIGARLTSAGLTNSPFLDGMAPLTASDRGGEYAYSPAEYMPQIRQALRLPELATPDECAGALERLAEYHELGGGAPVHGIDVPEYIAALRTRLALPMTVTVQELFEAALAMVGAAAGDGDEDVPPARPSSPEPSPAPPAPPKPPPSEDTTMSDALRLKDLETQNATLTLQLKEAQGELHTARAELTTLREWKTEREEADLLAEVDAAFETYKDKKNLSEIDKDGMLIVLKANPTKFREMYPAVKSSERHLLREHTTKRERGAPIQGEGETARLSRRELARSIAAQRGISIGEAQLLIERAERMGKSPKTA
jgi:hypothetical protein